MPHPAVRFGVLPNGMRYALMQIAAPPGAMSVRFHIAAGSSVEGEREQGYMHLLEHMIFHGSKNLPEGALQLMLSREGLRRWSDLNAFTSFDETVYRLDLTKSDGRARETALTVMREIAGNLSFERRWVEGAKQMVREEIRARNAVEDGIAAAQNAFFFPGSKIARGSVASSETSVKRATGAALQRLYQRHYVPQQATLIMVGDFDPAAAEAQIAVRFSGWPGAMPAKADVPASAVPARGTGEARVFVDPEAKTIVTIALAEPLGGADAARRRDSQFLEHLGHEMLNRRLARIAAAPDAPFLSANLASYDHFQTGRLTRLEVAAKDRDWARSLQAGGGELRRAADLGFSQAELDEQLAASQAALVASYTPKTSQALADAITDTVGRSIVFTAPGDPAATKAYLARIRLQDVNAAFKAAWGVPGRLIFVSHNRRIAGAEAAILAVWSGIGR